MSEPFIFPCNVSFVVFGSTILKSTTLYYPRIQMMKRMIGTQMWTVHPNRILILVKNLWGPQNLVFTTNLPYCVPLLIILNEYSFCSNFYDWIPCTAADNRKEKSLALLTQNFVKLFLCMDVRCIFWLNRLLFSVFLLVLILFIFSFWISPRWTWFPWMMLQRYCLKMERIHQWQEVLHFFGCFDYLSISWWIM